MPIVPTARTVVNPALCLFRDVRERRPQRAEQARGYPEHNGGRPCKTRASLLFKVRMEAAWLEFIPFLSVPLLPYMGEALVGFQLTRRAVESFPGLPRRFVLRPDLNR